jgi:hypothetical protein
MQALVLDDPARTRIPVEQVYTICRTTAVNDLARQLGLELSPIGQIVVTSEQHTNVPGVYAAGDATPATAAGHRGPRGDPGCLRRPITFTALSNAPPAPWMLGARAGRPRR